MVILGITSKRCNAIKPQLNLHVSLNWVESKREQPLQTPTELLRLPLYLCFLESCINKDRWKTFPIIITVLLCYHQHSLIREQQTDFSDLKIPYAGMIHFWGFDPMIRMKCCIKIVFIQVYMLSHMGFYNMKTFTGTQSLKRWYTYAYVLRSPINDDVAGVPQVAAAADVLWGIPCPVQSTDMNIWIAQVGWRWKNFCSWKKGVTSVTILLAHTLPLVTLADSWLWQKST